ncbi:MAG: alpha/beta hydrolase family protein [Deinococcales bacterium]
MSRCRWWRGRVGGLEHQPAHELWQRYQPDKAPYAFKAQDLASAKTWQRRCRRALSQTLGFQVTTFNPSAQVIESIDKGSYIREKILLKTAEHSLMPFYLLIPKSLAKKAATILAFHGHGYGVKDIVGLWEDGTEREKPDGIYKDFAVALCEQGFVVAAPEIACFGERQTDFSYLKLGQSAPSSCAHAAMLASHLGGSILGIRVRDSRRLLDYLSQRSECDSKNFAVMGLSGGGMVAFFTSCLDKHIKAAVISGYFARFQDSIHAMSHCACNYVHNLHQFGEIDDLAALIAPRPLFIEAGTRDPIFPIDSVKKSFARIEQIYQLFKAQDVLDKDYFEGRHRLQGDKAYDFLRKILLNGVS